MIFPEEYDIHSTIHVSRQSLILRATGKSDQRRVIIKTFNSEYPTIEEIAKLRHEYAILRLIDHPLVIKPIEMRNDRMVLVLEDIGGRSLKNMIQGNPLPLDRFFPIATRLAEGLAAIHQKQIIHQDCNPSNIIINEDSGEIKYIDFGMSTLLSGDALSIPPTLQIESTWDYISPEQTGRISRAIDYRSDLYSLGICFFELLNGELPFTSKDHLEKIHAHIAKDIDHLPKVQGEGAEVLLAIIRKLTAKTPEARYHSAIGLKGDLEKCLDHWQKHRYLPSFTPGENDVSSYFLIPKKVYGRETELGVLKETFQKVKEGSREIVIVSAPPGYGKTVTIQELKSNIVSEKGLYASGSTDQYKRNIPYAPLAEAIRELVQQSLTLNSRKLSDLKTRLAEALGANGQVILDIAPELEAIIGPQPPMLDLGPVELQNRFNTVFQNFINVFTSRHHPLVLFLDDLQWYDEPTLSFLQALLTTYKNSYLMVVGAYRTVDDHRNHFLATLSEIETSNTVTRLELIPWNEPTVNTFVSETLQKPEHETALLAKTILNKTDGNPLSTIEFLKALYAKKHVRFNFLQNCWEWDLDQVKNTDVKSSNIDSIVDRIHQLEPKSRELLTYAACIGPLFELSALALVSDLSRKKALSLLRPAIREGIITSSGRSYHTVMVDEEIDAKHEHQIFYRFSYDRIQQVYYQLIPEEDREALHLKIGRKSWQNEPELKTSGKLFFVLNQLNHSNHLISDPEEQLDLAAFNLIAGKKAKASNAYQSALYYLESGVNLLSESHWDSDFELMRDLHLEKAETEYQVGQFGQAMIGFDMLVKKSESVIEQVKIRRRKIVLYTNYGEYESAVKEGVSCLQLLGMPFPEDQKAVLPAIQKEIEQFKSLIKNKEIDDLIDLPALKDEKIICMMSILINLDAPAYFYDSRILGLVLVRIVNLSLQYGNCDVSALGYASFAGIIGGQLGDYKSAFEFGRLGANLNKLYQNAKLFPKVSMSQGAFANHWGDHLQSSISIMKAGYAAGIENGDMVNAAFCLGGMIRHLQAVGHHLEDYRNLATEHLRFIERAKFFDQTYYYLTAQRYAMSLQGLTSAIGEFGDADFDESKFIAALERSTNKAALHWFYVLKAQLHYLAGHPEMANEYLEAAELLKSASMGQIQLVEHYWIKSLVLAALYPASGENRQTEILAALKEIQEKMSYWAALCPDNYQHKSCLIDAKLAEINRETLKAIDAYDNAIESAAKYRFVHCEALCNEEAANYFISLKKEKIARVYLLEARNGYLNWGAIAKVEELDNRFQKVLDKTRTYYRQPSDETTGKPTSSFSKIESTTIELDTILKASSILSSELLLDKLLEKLMKIVLENAGAQDGFLILKQQDKMVIEAKGSYDNQTFNIGMDEVLDLTADDSSSSPLPVSVLNYAIHTKKTVVLTQPEGYGRFAKDSYLDRKKPQSALCVPLLYQDNLIGLWYLENNLVSGAFSESRLETISLLSAQMAVSIENAKLYRNLKETAQKLEESNVTLEQKVAERTEELHAKNSILNNALKEMKKAKESAEEANRYKTRFLANISHELRTPMHGILGFAKLGQSRSETATRNRLDSYFSSILTSGQRLLSLLNDLLDLSRLEASQMEYLFSKHPLSAILKVAIDEMNPVAANKEIKLIKVLPDFDDSIDLDCDKMHQVFINLISNAVKYSDPGTTVRFSIVNRSKQVLFAIRDEGVGVPEAELSKIFGHFYQSSATSDGSGGTGLGLTIAKQIIIDHQGQIWAENNDNKGITVKFQLPKNRS